MTSGFNKTELCFILLKVWRIELVFKKKKLKKYFNCVNEKTKNVSSEQHFYIITYSIVLIFNINVHLRFCQNDLLKCSLTWCQLWIASILWRMEIYDICVHVVSYWKFTVERNYFLDGHLIVVQNSEKYNKWGETLLLDYPRNLRHVHFWALERSKIGNAFCKTPFV